MADIATIFSSAQGALNGIQALLASIGSGVAVLGVANNAIGSTALPSLNFSEFELPLRLVIYIIITGGLAVGLSYVSTHLLAKRTEASVFVARAVAVLWAGLLIGTADWLAEDTRRNTTIPQFTLLSVIGTLVVFRVLSFQFSARASRKRRDPAGMLRQTSLIVLYFSLGLFFFFFIVLLGSQT